MSGETPDGRQRVERVPGARRARLTPAPDTDPVAPGVAGDDGPDAAPSEAASGPNDERMRQDVPPHY